MQSELGDVARQEPDHGADLWLTPPDFRSLEPLTTELQGGQGETDLAGAGIELAGRQGEAHGLITCQYKMFGRSIRMAPSASTGSRPSSRRTASRSSTVPPHQRRYSTPRNADPSFRLINTDLRRSNHHRTPPPPHLGQATVRPRPS